MDWVLQQSGLHWQVLVVAFAAIALWETVQPWRELHDSTVKRWTVHAALLAVASLVAGVLIRFGSLGVAAWASASGFGLLNATGAPLYVAIPVTIAVVDFVHWAQHWAFHSVSWLWRLHQVHHSDRDIDLTTGLRFHPAETILTKLSYLAAVALLGPPLIALLAVELATIAQNFFVHANSSLPRRLSRLLLPVLVTPDVHRLHHSVDVRDQQTNFGTLFPWWDRLFGTWRYDPERVLEFGLEEALPEQSLHLGELLITPFRDVRYPPSGVWNAPDSRHII